MLNAGDEIAEIGLHVLKAECFIHQALKLMTV